MHKSVLCAAMVALVGCSSPTSPQGNRTDTGDTEPADIAPDTTGHDTAPIDATSDALPSDTGDDTTDTSDATADTTSDTRPHWDAGVNCQPSTTCCDSASMTPENGGESCDDGDPSTERTRCQQGACRECECSDADKPCCDGCFFEPPSEICQLSSGARCKGGNQNNCGGRLYEVDKEWTCTGYLSVCPKEPTYVNENPAAARCSDDRECFPSLSGMECRAEVNSDC